MFRLFIVIVSTLTTLYANYTCPNPKDFEIAHTTNERGDIELIGNTVMCKDGGNGECSDPGNERNNDIDMMYVDVDNQNTFNSSGARLNVPDNAEILWAGLYWQGYLDGGTDSEKSDTARVKLGFDSSGDPTNLSYSNIQATNHNWIYLSADRFYYQGSYEITSFVENNHNGWYYVADIMTEEGQPIGGSYGAWSIAIVYKDENSSLKNLTVYDGYKGIVTSGDETEATNYANNNNCVSHGTGHSMDVLLSGFLTPLSGTVSSKFFIFAGEGDDGTDDSGARGDHLKLTDSYDDFIELENDANPNDDIFNSTISKNGTHLDSTDLDPFNSTNSNGIDIDVFDISNIIDNGQTETTVRLDTDGDGYMPSVFGFSTELYEPRVCYAQEFYNLDGTKVTDVNDGDEIIVDIYISNQAKDEDTGDIETAKGVTVTSEIDSDVLEFLSNSLRVQNVEETEFTYYTDSNDTGLAAFDPDTNETTFWVGEGAENGVGGKLEENADVFARYNATVEAQGDITVDNDYFVTYEDAVTGQTWDNPVPIEECQEVNASFFVLQPPTGRFNVVHEGADMSSGDPLGGNRPKNALYTQIDGKDFNVDVVSLDADNVSLKNSNADITLELVDGTDIDDTLQSCENASKLKVFDEYKGQMFFNNEAQKTWMGLSYDKAHRNARFRIRYMDFDEYFGLKNFNCNNSSRDTGNIAGVPQCLNARSKVEEVYPECAVTDICESNLQAKSVDDIDENSPYYWECYECIMGINDPICSRDNFAIRPKEYEISFDSPPPGNLPIAARKYGLSIKALSQSGTNNSADYNQSIGNVDINVTKYFNPDYAVAVDTNGTLHGDKNVTASNPFSDGFLDDINISYSDVGKIDVNFIDEDWAWVDLKDKPVQNSDPNLNNVEVNGTLSGYRWIPAKFVFNTFTMHDHNSSYTYLSNDLNMSAKIQYNISAVNDNNNTTLNYGDRDDGLWERNITIEPALQYDGQNAVFNDFNQTDMDFQNGVITADHSDPEVITFNFDRDPNTVQEPFNVILDGSVGFDFNTTIEDTDGVDGNTSSADGNVTFYYANLYAPDVQSDQEVVDAVAYVEVFCENGSYGTSCAGYDLSQESVDRMNWWQFTQHQNGSGKLIRAESSASSVDIEDDGTVSNMNVDLSAQNDINVEYTGGKNHYKTKITIAPDPWLSYHRYIPYNATAADNDQNFFYIQWDLGAGDWAGVGDERSTVDLNASDNAQQRIDW